MLRVISADELMKVMISLGNPRTEAEIKVGEQWPLKFLILKTLTRR